MASLDRTGGAECFSLFLLLSTMMQFLLLFTSYQPLPDVVLGFTSWRLSSIIGEAAPGDDYQVCTA